ncbi:hypothetical protein [Streptomyces sp. NPDC055058]
MTAVIVAGALGVIVITGGLFLRRLLGELKALRGQLTELRRQITGIEGQLRRQRAHVNFLRQLLADNGDTNDTDSGLPPQAAAVNGHEPPPTGPAPVRRKRHLGLYIGGAAAALAAFSGVVGDLARQHRGQVVGALAGSAVTAATVSLVVIQPWSTDTGYEGYEAPPIAPTVSIPPAPMPPLTRPPGPPPEPSPTTSPPTSDPPGSPSPSAPRPSDSAPPTPAVTTVPVGNTLSPPDPPSGTAEPSGAADAAPSRPAPGASDGTPSRPPTSTPSVAPSTTPGVCVDVAVPPLLNAGTCLLSG